MGGRVVLKKRVLRSNPNDTDLIRSGTKRRPLMDTSDVNLIDDVWYQILSCLDVSSLAQCKQVCKTWRGWCSDDWLWKGNVERVRNKYVLFSKRDPC